MKTELIEIPGKNMVAVIVTDDRNNRLADTIGKGNEDYLIAKFKNKLNR